MTAKFQVPTIEEVQRYFELKGIKTLAESQKFWLHYESNGWYVGKSKMRSWRAAAGGWILRMEKFQKDQPQPIKNVDTSNKNDAIKQAEINQIKRAYKNQMI
jgi:hypothetical protein